MNKRNLPAIEIRNLDFCYEGGSAVFSNLSLCIPAASRVLVIGANGVGKSTLLRIIAGHHLLRRESLTVYGRSPFYDIHAGTDIALVDGDFPIHVDLRVQEMLNHAPQRLSVDVDWEKELLQILEINPSWRMCHVSEGQKRRVQLLLALRKPLELLLLDEVTSHLDIVVRSRFLDWLKERSLKEGLTLLYATHILDGLWIKKQMPWPTHLLFIAQNGHTHFCKTEDLKIQNDSYSPLLEKATSWIKTNTFTL